MEENSEVEQGEACSFCNENLDPDIDLSYIDEKLKNVLGHLQKDFEGWGVSAEKLGTKFGGYGTFLPSYECSSAVQSHPRTPQRNSSIPRCPKSLLTKDEVRDFKALPNAPPSVRPGTTNHEAHSPSNANTPSGDALVNKDPSLLSAQVSRTDSQKEGNFNKSGNATNKKSLTVRIKMGSSCLAPKVATICNDLGLGDSLSASSGERHDEGGGMPPLSQEITSKSPSSILQDMTLGHAPGGVLISPLHDSLLSLTTKETGKAPKESKAVLSARKGESAISKNESCDVLGNGKTLNQMRLRLVKKGKKETTLSDEFKRTTLSNSLNNGDFTEATGMLSEKYGDADKYRTGDRKFSSYLVKKAPTGSGGSETINSRKHSMRKQPLKQRVEDSFSDASDENTDKGNSKGNMTASSLKETLFEDKKNPKIVSASAKAGSPYGARTSKSKLQKDINKTCNNQRHLPYTNSEISGGRSKNYGVDDVKKMPVIKSPERSSSKIFDNKTMSGTVIKDVADAGNCKIEDGLTYAGAASLTANPIAHDNWVECDRCGKWRLLPLSVDPGQLPAKWSCRMQSWLPGMNYCGISEDATSKAVMELSQIPITGVQTNLQCGVDKLASDITAADVCNVNQSHQHLSSMSNQGKKKSAFIQTAKSLNNLQESAKGKSPNYMKQPQEKHTAIKKFGLPGKSCDFGEDSDEPQQKEKHFNGGAAKQIKMVKKMGADKFGNETSKGFKPEARSESLRKINMEDLYPAEKNKQQGRGKFSVEVKCSGKKILITSSKVGHQAQDISGGQSSGSKGCDPTKGHSRKRKFMEWQDHQGGSGEKLHAKESKESEYKKEKKVKVLKPECEQYSTSNSNNVSVKTLMEKQCYPSASGIHQGNGLEEHRKFDEEPVFQKRKGSPVSQQIIDGVDSSSRDFSSRQVSVAATSSSSKVMGSHKTAVANVEEVKASPVESVSSSPRRTSRPEKLLSKADNAFKKEITVNGGAFASKNINVRRYQDPEGDDEIDSVTEPRIRKQSKPKDRDQDQNLGASSCKNDKTTPKQNHMQDYGFESKAYPIKTESGSLQSKSCLDQQVKPETQYHLLVPPSHLECRIDSLPSGASGNDNTPKVLKQAGDDDNENGAGIRKFIALTPMRLNAPSQVADNVLKEAVRLKKNSDHFESSEFEFESKVTKFKAALKFLYGASLLEACHGENVRRGEMNHMEAYVTSAKLFESCAHEYEKKQEMAAAALVYKCMEVAYMRMLYCKSLSTSRYWNELQTALQMVPQGDSPSSSVSDVDNLNHQVSSDKYALAKAFSPPVAGNHVIIARTRQNCVRLLDFAQATNFAIEASRKSQNAFSAAIIGLEEAKNRDCIAAMQKAINFSFHDVEALIHLVELAMNSVSRPDLGGGRD